MINSLGRGMDKELQFLRIAEGLKRELRHSWLSNYRQESVAEHSWRLALMVIRYAPKLDRQIDIEKCLKYAILHDLPEAITGDIPSFDCQSDASKAAKMQQEQQAMHRIKALLADEQGDELYATWMEYEQGISYESQFVKALDKLEAFIQHNEAPLDTWEEQEKTLLGNSTWLEEYCRFDSFLFNLCKVVIKQTQEKLQQIDIAS